MADGSWPFPVIRSASFCTGIGGWEVATETVGGFEHLFFSEIEAFPSAVLAHHWPTVSNFGDLTQMDCTWWRGRVDAVWGSCPCQAFSFAGRRKGMKDKRGALTLAFLDRVDEIDPTYVLYENVKGILSDKSNAFGCLLGALAGEDGPLIPPGGKWSHAGYVLGPKRTIAWRLFDAQHGGVPQRRERVFVVGSTRNGADPRDILFEREGLRRDHPPIRGPQEAVAALTARGVGTCGAEDNQAQAGHLIPVAFGGNNSAGPIDVAPALLAHGGPHGRLDFGTETFLVSSIQGVADTVTAENGSNGGANGGDCSPLRNAVVSVTGDITHALKGAGADASEDGTGRGNPIIAFSSKDHGADATADLSPTLRAMPHDGSHPNSGGQMAIAYSALSVALRGRDEGSQIELGDEVANSLRNGSAGGGLPRAGADYRVDRHDQGPRAAADPAGVRAAAGSARQPHSDLLARQARPAVPGRASLQGPRQRPRDPRRPLDRHAPQALPRAEAARAGAGEMRVRSGLSGDQRQDFVHGEAVLGHDGEQRLDRSRDRRVPRRPAAQGAFVQVEEPRRADLGQAEVAQGDAKGCRIHLIDRPELGFVDGEFAAVVELHGVPVTGGRGDRARATVDDRAALVPVRFEGRADQTLEGDALPLCEGSLAVSVAPCRRREAGNAEAFRLLGDLGGDLRLLGHRVLQRAWTPFRTTTSIPDILSGSKRDAP